MRPAALLTGSTGIVAVMVLVYVGLTAMNLQPHITFGDPDKVVASADVGEAVKPTVPVVTPLAPPSPPSAAVPTPASAAPSVGKPAPPPLAEVPAPAEPPPAAAVPDMVSSATTTSQLPGPPASAAPAAALLPVAAAEPAKQPAVVPPEAAPSPPSTPAIAEVAPPKPPPVKVSDAPPVVSHSTMPVIAEAKPTVTAETKPIEEASKSEAADHASASLPLLPTIPTPLARPEPPVEMEVKATPEPGKPAEQTPPAKVEPPVEEASLPPAEAEAAGKPEMPADAQAGKIEPGADLKPVDLSRPLAERAGILTIGNKVVQLAGIMPTDPARSCTGPNGKEWPCGTLARTALRAFLLGRTVTCDVPDPQWKGPVTAECRFARVSISDWLARNGWAEPAAGSPLMAVAEEARKDGRGIYGNDPRKEHKSTLAPTPPPEDPLNPI